MKLLLFRSNCLTKDGKVYTVYFNIIITKIFLFFFKCRALSLWVSRIHIRYTQMSYKISISYVYILYVIHTY